MRTQEEIAKRVEEKRKEFLSFAPEVMLPYLDYEYAKPHIKPEITKDEWPEYSTPYTRESVLDEAAKYMATYGWDKAENHRGLSASRTVDKMEAWIWLLGKEEDDFLEEMKATPYENYGAPKLKLICEHFGWPISDDEGVLRMAQGLPCRDGCDEGCGS